MNMAFKSWIFLIILVDSGETSAEDKPCDLPLIENGKIAQYYYSFKSYYFPMSKEKKLSYTCVAGYTTESGSQDARITCTATGWSPAPKCYKKCSKPLLENGIFSDTKVSYKIWEQLLYRCASGYQTPGGNADETVQCLPEGWSSHPSCAKKFESCLVPDLHHGHYSTTQRILKLNETLMYECDEGYHTRGGNTIEKAVCRTYGWSLTPNCTKVTCFLLSEIEHGNFYPRKKSYEEGDVVQFLCQKNYSLNGSDLIQCYDFGWYPEPPICEDRRNKCPPPPQPPNANILTDLRTYHNGAKVHLACQLNFTMRGSEEIQCENGKWTSPPSCIVLEAKEKISCDQPPPIEKGTAITEEKMYYTGDTIRYSCDHGYRINGSSVITCKMGKWTSPPKCIETRETCPSPPAIKSGASFGPLLTNYTTGSSVKYRCHRYHILEGPETVHCVQGKWTAQPTCLEPCTLNVDDVSNNNIEMKWRLEGELFFLHGETIDFVCKQGYYLSSSSRQSQLTVQCTRGKIIYPTCIMEDPKEKCGSPPIIKNGDVIDPRLTEYESDSSVEYTCFDHHFLQGSNRVYCSNGQWTTPPDCIEPCILSKDVMDKNNLILRWSFDDKSYSFHGEYIEFLCKENHYGAPSTSVFDFRIQCSRGQLTYPRCVERGR
nr:coagulation factor XIII B chain [Chrysemys picta bellii]